MNTFKKTIISALMISSVFTLGACGAEDDDSSSRKTTSNGKVVQIKPNTDPKKGWVSVFGEKSNLKRCDGTNLIYRLKWDSDYGTNYSQSVAPNSRECNR